MHSTEHFCTLFDNNFLPQGLCLLESLKKHAKPFHLWILCMDDLVEKNLKKVAMADGNITLIPLHTIESESLLEVKGGRTRGEYCWTLTPFLPGYVLKNNPTVPRITYVDADLFFFDNPGILLQEMDRENKDVLITEHAFAPEYEQSETSGRFCVQFLTFLNSEASMRVLGWWQERCIEWCFARHEDGKFGDQKYLDLWPSLFAKEVHIVEQKEKTLAPWNIRFYGRKVEVEGKILKPVFYHFHGLRIIAKDKVKLFFGYRVGSHAGKKIYSDYLGVLQEVRQLLEVEGIPWPTLPEPRKNFSWIYNLKHLIFGTQVISRI